MTKSEIIKKVIQHAKQPNDSFSVLDFKYALQDGAITEEEYNFYFEKL